MRVVVRGSVTLKLCKLPLAYLWGGIYTGWGRARKPCHVSSSKIVSQISCHAVQAKFRAVSAVSCQQPCRPCRVSRVSHAGRVNRVSGILRLASRATKYSDGPASQTGRAASGSGIRSAVSAVSALVPVSAVSCQPILAVWPCRVARVVSRYRPCRVLPKHFAFRALVHRANRVNQPHPANP